MQLLQTTRLQLRRQVKFISLYGSGCNHQTAALSSYLFVQSQQRPSPSEFASS